MKHGTKQKIIITTGLTAICLGMVLCGCAAEEKETDQLVIEPIVSGEDVQVNPPEPAPDSQSLYEQFLNGCIPATVDSDYSEGDYSEQILEKNTSFTLAELENRVSAYFFDPEYTDKTSCDQIQYAYVDCPDSSDQADRNLLVKFVGLNIYSPDDDSYAVFILSENDGQLYVTDSYQCWARSETTAYANGVLHSFGSNGAGDHGEDLFAILSNGKPASIYSAHILSGEWAGDVNASIYHEVIDENTVPPALTVSIYTIGSENYYQYDMTYCEEAEIPLCETYINRCRDEAGIHWASEEEIQTAVQDQCNAVGIDSSLVETQEETVWTDL